MNTAEKELTDAGPLQSEAQACPTMKALVKLQPRKLVTHRFALSDAMNAYDTFGNAGPADLALALLEE